MYFHPNSKNSFAIFSECQVLTKTNWIFLIYYLYVYNIFFNFLIYYFYINPNY